MSNLRQEIIESSKMRADYIKWKLLIVAVLGATGLGLGIKIEGQQAIQKYAYLTLVLIPLVCVLVDLLCKHNTLRIVAIGAFKRTFPDDEENKYEHFALACAGGRIYSLEEYALSHFTYSVSFLSIIIGLIILFQNTHLQDSILDHLPEILFLSSGAIGLFFTRKFNNLFDEYCKKISEIENDFKGGSQKR